MSGRTYRSTHGGITVEIDLDALDERPDCEHCDDDGCRACDPDSTATPRAWLR